MITFFDLSQPEYHFGICHPLTKRCLLRSYHPLQHFLLLPGSLAPTVHPTLFSFLGMEYFSEPEIITPLGFLIHPDSILIVLTDLYPGIYQNLNLANLLKGLVNPDSSRSDS